MAIRARLFSTLTALLAVAAVLVPAGSARPSVLPTLYVAYTMNCTFGITDDSGKKVTSIAPGDYQVYVETPIVFADVDLTGIFDMTACKSFVQFQLTGPGVNLATTLQQGDEDKELLNATFQPNGTYTFQDNNQPTVARAVVTTTATGSAPQPAGPTTSSTSAKGTTQKELAGSAVLPFRGALDAIVYASGKLALAHSGKAVTSIMQGRYTIDVDDESISKGFTIQRNRHAAITLTTGQFKGEHALTISMSAGQWFFYSPAGTKSYFIVSK